uniref:Delta-like protein n=1 Tax=Angiostrongylus cantonensis TaxID=6313 RepID=A0A158P7P9_ANGCA
MSSSTIYLISCGTCGDEYIACQHCDLRTSFCKSHSKSNYTCECRVGYEKNQYGECVDIDECRGYTAVCDRNAWCTNTIGSYQCECMAAYRGDGSHCTFVGLGRSSLDCRDCSPNATCENGVCQCKTGFEGDGFNCTDVNECLRMPYICDKSAECLNREGSYICTCLSGYAGNGFNCTKAKNACLDKFDRGYQETCGGENWRQHFFLDHESKVCQQFWYDGCHGRSRNIFSDLETCEQMCEATKILTRAEICWDKFDVNYRNQCLNGHWKQRYYFDHASLTCRQFWYDGCRSDSRNMFEDLLTCQWLCESQPMYKSRACLQDFDSHYKDQCSGGRWRQQYYFDKNAKRCIPFWYDGCTGESENIFQDESSCLHTCENPAKNDPLLKKKFRKICAFLEPNLTDICAVSNPCRNNSICVFVWKKNTYYCKCEDGYTGQNCTEKIDSDPCATHPCKNGATCLAKVQKGKTTFECYCTIGYGGPHCDQRPCDVNPCLHNGTCRTTAGLSSYFCECREGFGGKNCDITIGSKLPEERYGSNVLLVSSGKAEWIQEMKKRLGGQKKTTPPSIADEPYKGDSMANLLDRNSITFATHASNVCGETNGMHEVL